MMRLITIDADVKHGGEDVFSTNIVVVIPGRWLRAAVYLGPPPGSHQGLWHTETGTVHGWNYRIGDLRRSLTLLAHTRKDPS